MQDEKFEAWLETRNLRKGAIATRVSSVRKVDAHLTELGLKFTSLDHAWNAGEYERVTNRLREIMAGLQDGDDSYKVILPQSEEPEARLRNFISWVRQYRQFLEDQAGVGKRSDWPALEHMRDTFLERLPDFESFQSDEGEYFEIERSYKQNILDAVATACRRLENDPEALGREIASLMQHKSGPLIRWQTLDRFEGDFLAAAPQFYGALGRLALSEGLNADTILDCILTLFSLKDQGVTALTRGEILSIAISVAGCVDPMQSAPFKIQKAQKFAEGLLDRRLFSNDNELARDVSAWLELLGRIYDTMSRVWEWAPRDLFDVQGFAWVVLDQNFAIEEENAMSEASGEASYGAIASGPAQPLNQILYGPPGTGKTFQLAELAVKICDNDLPVDEDGRVDRKLTQSRYEELRERGRIEFVTFHQSYSYEEFVEGLRPETGVSEDSEASAGFRLQPEDGVFRRISRLAEKAKAARPTSDQHLERSGVFKASLGPTWDEGFAYLFEECIEHGYILLGYGGEVDWSSDDYEDFRKIAEKWNTIDPTASGNDPNIKQVFTLRAAMTQGDLVVVSNGNLRFRAIGRITGPYEYVPREQDEYHHRRSVEWLWVDRGEGLSHSDIYEKKFSQQALYRMVDAHIKWPTLEEIVSGNQSGDHGPRPPYVLIIDEINRANISKVFGELITLLEPDKRIGAEHQLKVRLPYSKEDFGVPSNLYVLGTMNTADRSIALLDTALRRRFEFQEMMPRPELLKTDVDGLNLRSILRTLNERIEYLFDRDHQIGHAYFMGREVETRTDVDNVIRRKVIPLLVEYFYEDWEKVRRVLGETTNDGSFILRTRIKAPVSADDEYDTEDRWRYEVRARFADDAYEQLGS